MPQQMKKNKCNRFATSSAHPWIQAIGLLTFLFAASFFPSISKAQSNAADGALNGYVTDTTGAIVPNSTVVLRSQDTNVQTVRHADNQGYFRFPLVPVGTYELAVKASGYGDYVRKGITVAVGSEVSVNPKLGVGEAKSTVVVTADASMISESSPAITGFVTEKEMRDLPIVSRNIYNLFLFTPGAKGIPSSTFATPGYSFGGVLRSTWNVDGLDDTSRATTSPIRLVINTPGSIKQVQVLANGYQAEFGKSTGGQMNLVTRSGGDTFHGSAMYLNRPQALAAIPTFAHSKANLDWYMYALNLGGPVIRKHVFFFANFEHNPSHSPTTSRITPATVAALQLTPDQIADQPHGETYNSPSVRVDYKINEKNSGFLRYSRFTNKQPYLSTGGFFVKSRAQTGFDNENAGELQLASTSTPKVLNELRYGINRRETYGVSTFPAKPDDVDTTVSGYAYLGNSPSTSRNIETSNQVVDNVSWQHGKHFIKFGADYQRVSYFARSALARSFTFGGLAANKSRPKVTALNQYLYTLAGDIDPSTKKPYTYTTLSVSLGDPSITRNIQFISAFVQDEYRLSPRLVAIAGLRYEKKLLPEAVPDSTYALAQKRIHGRDFSFAPRLSLAFSPNDRTSVRGSAGIFFDVPNLTFFTAEASTDGNRYHAYTVAGTASTAPKYPTIPDAVGAQFMAKPNLYVIDPDFRAMYAVQSNLQVEQAFTQNLSVRFQYMYFGTRFGPYLHDTNLTPTGEALADGRPVYTTKTRPNPNYGQINELFSHGNTSYNGLDVTVNKRMSHGLLVAATYSWSHALGDSDQNGYAVSDPSDVRRDYGNLSTDVRHYFVLRALYTAHTSVSWLRWANGIGLSTMTMVTSGRPLNPLAGADLNGDLATNDRPLFVQRNSLRGPNYALVNARASKTFTFEKRFNFELMAEADNLLNHKNAACSVTGCNGAINGNVNSDSFGLITAAAPSRTAQVGGRFTF